MAGYPLTLALSHERRGNPECKAVRKKLELG